MATTFTTVRSGNWSDVNPATSPWGGAGPADGDNITIADNHILYYDMDNSLATLGWGVCKIHTGAKLKIREDVDPAAYYYKMAAGGYIQNWSASDFGTLEAGTSALVPLSQTITITFDIGAQTTAYIGAGSTLNVCLWGNDPVVKYLRLVKSTSAGGSVFQFRWAGTGNVVTNVLTDATKSWTSSTLIGMHVHIAGGHYLITANTGTTLTAAGMPDGNGQAYSVTWDWSDEPTLTTDQANGFWLDTQYVVLTTGAGTLYHDYLPIADIDYDVGTLTVTGVSTRTWTYGGAITIAPRNIRVLGSTAVGTYTIYAHKLDLKGVETVLRYSSTSGPSSYAGASSSQTISGCITHADGTYRASCSGFASCYGGTIDGAIATAVGTYGFGAVYSHASTGARTTIQNCAVMACNYGFYSIANAYLYNNNTFGCSAAYSQGYGCTIEDCFSSHGSAFVYNNRSCKFIDCSSQACTYNYSGDWTDSYFENFTPYVPYGGTDMIAGCQLTSLKNCLMPGTNEMHPSYYSGYYGSYSVYTESFDHDQTPGAFKCWSSGGYGVNDSSIALPSGFSFSYKMTANASTTDRPVQLIRKITVEPKQQLAVVCWMRKDFSESTEANRPYIAIFEDGPDPLYPKAVPWTYLAGPTYMSDVTNVWESKSISWINTYARPYNIIIRMAFLRTSGNAWFTYAINPMFESMG